MMVVPKALTDIGVLTLQFLIRAVPLVLIVLLYLKVNSDTQLIFLALAVPVVYVLSYVLVAGTLSLPFQKAIVKGIFPRDSRFPVYAMRRCYGICWTSIYYSPIYNVVLSYAPLRWLVFRLFGYRGSNNINLYPDSWIRDLPLLRIEEGAYISNRCSLGSNISLIQGLTMVGNITIKKGAMIGAHGKVGLGATVGERTEFGIECITGLHVKIGNDSIIGSCTELSHYSKVGNNTKIGIGCYIGTSAVIGDNITIPNKTFIPDKALVLTQEDVEKYVRLAGQL